MCVCVHTYMCMHIYMYHDISIYTHMYTHMYYLYTHAVVCERTQNGSVTFPPPQAGAVGPFASRGTPQEENHGCALKIQ